MEIAFKRAMGDSHKALYLPVGVGFFLNEVNFYEKNYKWQEKIGFFFWVLSFSFRVFTEKDRDEYIKKLHERNFDDEPE